MRKKSFLKGIAAAVLLCVTSLPQASADKLDSYRNILMNEQYTIRYENISPTPRNKNGDAVTAYSRSSLNVSAADFMLNKPTQCLVVASGDTRYEEVAMGESNRAVNLAAGGLIGSLIGGKRTNELASTCRLRKGGDTFVYTKYEKPNKVSYYGMSGKKNEVEAVDTDYVAIGLSGESFGANDATVMLNAMLPNTNRPEGTASFQKMGEGTLPDGRSYIDYKSHFNRNLELIRYYFNGNEMVKIAAGFYTTDASGEIIDGRHCILNIAEFTSDVDKKYLSLPAGVKDKTDYKKRAQED